VFINALYAPFLLIMSAFKGKSKKGSILDLNNYLNTEIRVKFSGGREVCGVLVGYDPLLNLVLDSSKESIRDPFDPYKTTNAHRQLGLIVARGPAVVVVSPVNGTEEIANPFTNIQQNIID